MDITHDVCREYLMLLLLKLYWISDGHHTRRLFKQAPAALVFYRVQCIECTLFASASSGLDSGSPGEQAGIVGSDVCQHTPAWQHDGLTWPHLIRQTVDRLHKQK